LTTWSRGTTAWQRARGRRWRDGACRCVVRDRRGGWREGGSGPRRSPAGDPPPPPGQPNLKVCGATHARALLAPAPPILCPCLLLPPPALQLQHLAPSTALNTCPQSEVRKGCPSSFKLRATLLQRRFIPSSAFIRTLPSPVILNTSDSGPPPPPADTVQEPTVEE